MFDAVADMVTVFVAEVAVVVIEMDGDVLSEAVLSVSPAGLLCSLAQLPDLGGYSPEGRAA